MSEPWQLSAAALGRAYRERRLSPLDALESCLARLDAVNPRINAVIAQPDRAALRAAAAASAARHARGAPLSPLDGVPLTLKDNLPSADLPTTWGGVRTLDGTPDELAVARARAAGAIAIGKTNVPSFTLEGYTANARFGVTRNPWDLDLTPGGSSGGAVAGLAAGIAPLALGTDGGGSIRRPASHCGVVGLKPSIGALPREHTLPSLLLDFEVVGPMARTVADARLLFDALRGPHPADRHSLAADAAARALTRDPGALRVRYVPTLDDAPVDPAIAASCRRAADRLADLGHDVTEGALGLDLGFMAAAWPIVGQVGLAALFEREPAWREGAAPAYRERAERGARVGAAALWQAVEQVERLRRDCARRFESVDVFVTPAAAALPWPADQAYPPRIAGREVGPRGHAVFTGWVNAAGLPALAVPAEASPAGLPIGIQLIGGYGADHRLLDLGAALEAAHPWVERRPPL
ncbi:MAG TPA: amidase [Burkholderiaceae bacterium]